MMAASHAAGDLGPALLGDVAKDEHDPEQRAIGQADGRGTVPNGDFPAVARQKHGMVRQTRRSYRLEHARDGIIGGQTRVLIDDVKDLGQRLPRASWLGQPVNCSAAGV